MAALWSLKECRASPSSPTAPVTQHHHLFMSRYEELYSISPDIGGVYTHVCSRPDLQTGFNNEEKKNLFLILYIFLDSMTVQALFICADAFITLFIT